MSRTTQFIFGSIRGRLILLSSAVLILAMCGGVVLALQAYGDEKRLVEDRLNTTARSLSTMVDRLFAERIALVRGLASSSALRQGDVPAFLEETKAVHFSADEGLIAVTPTGSEILNTLTGPFGTSGGPAADPDLMGAVQRGQIFVSNVQAGGRGKNPSVFIAVPFTDSGQILGALVYRISPTILEPVPKDSVVPGQWIVSVIDRTGLIAARNLSPERYVGQRSRKAVVDLAQSGGGGFIGGKTLDGIEILTTVSRGTLSGWAVAVGAPRATLYASARHLLLVTLVASLGLALILTWTTIWVATGVIGEVQGLVAETEEIASGKIPLRIGGGIEEINTVSDALRASAIQLVARERELHQLNESLDARVQLRTRELAEANRELENFARIASHDLKEPLRLMSAYASLLSAEYEQHLDTAGRTYVARIEAAADRQRGLIDQILSYARLAGEAAPSEWLDLNEVVSSVLAEHEKTLKSLGAKVQVGSLPKVYGNRHQLTQLLSSLIGNAAKFHRDGVAAEIQIRATPRENFIVIEVQDNGIGFEMKYAERIFAPLERLNAGNKYPGAGLGLAIVRRIAERHGGSAQARSEFAVGSTFEISLPIPKQS